MTHHHATKDELQELVPAQLRLTHVEECEHAWAEFGFEAAEMLCLKLISYGLDCREIPEVTGFTLDAVRRSLSHMRRQLGAKNNAHLMRKAFEQGLLT